MSRASTPGPEPATPVAALAARLVAVAAVLAVLAWAYKTELLELAALWSRDPNYSHGYLVIPIVGFMFWWLWPRGAEADRLRPCPWGWALLAGLVAVRFALLRGGHYWLEGFTLVPTVGALVLAYGGWRLLWRTWPAVAFLVFMFSVPPTINSQVSLPLQRVASIASAGLMRLLGFWVMDEGNVLVIGGEKLEVAAACNGLAMLMSLAATISAFVILVPMANWKRVALLLSVVPVALLCNILRIAGTAYAYHLLGSKRGQELAHDVAGWLMMPLALVIVLLELAWLSWLVTEDEAAEPVSPTLMTTAGIRPSPPRR
ncbi:exosortase/archaeosortase family protein [Tautonia sociabilis]|uniref:Exosortase/archaeosortase family protein n=1 Tax=Tautonia sociabilis TaxID=2080755 RepID=A0A432MFL1_9BACT|nr:exosortase/archaeosortase family protein [Tautonia sociabilis]RUL84919.1 exosortase/archaeosortase family protein [Tautonia sociabilis]